MNKRAGFTIVELLIVIVVIGILAAITIISYRGISDRAYNTQIVAGVRQYHSLLLNYKITEGEFPKTTPELNGDRITMVCVGDNYEDDLCGDFYGAQTSVDAAFNELLSGYSGSGVPKVGNSYLSTNTASFVGAAYGIDSVYSNVYPSMYGRTIQYALKGKDVDCVLSDAWQYASQENPATTSCEIDLEEVANRG